MRIEKGHRGEEKEEILKMRKEKGWMRDGEKRDGRG